MKRILDPSSTIAVIFGASEWEHAGLPVAPSFRRSAARLMQYLLAPEPRGHGLDPDLALNLFDDPSPPSDILHRMREEIRRRVSERKIEGRPINDILLYYIGHGELDDQRHLHLLVRDTKHGMEIETSIAASSLSQVIRNAAPEQRKVVILDCCFSEAAVEAFGAMGAFDEAIASSAIHDLAPNPTTNPSRGTVVLCSSPKGRVSIGPPAALSTLFTGSLLSVLVKGAQYHASEFLSLADLRHEVFAMMSDTYDGSPPRPALHQPDQQAGDLTDLPAFPNAIAKSAPTDISELRMDSPSPETPRKLIEEHPLDERNNSGTGHARRIQLPHMRLFMISIILSVVAAATFSLVHDDHGTPSASSSNTERPTSHPQAPAKAILSNFQPQNPDVFCDRLVAVAQSASQGFKKMLGPRGDMQGSYKPKVSLPGAGWCSFNTIPGFGNLKGYVYYNCSVWSENGDMDQARTAFNAYADLVKKCLGTTWVRSDIKEEDGDIRATFDLDGDHATVDVKLHTGTDRKPGVYVDIDPPGH
jgi:hypothetical protein